MADTRLNLDNELRAIKENVYFQPPESLKLKYPCFIYNLSSITPIYADDKTYKYHRRWQITYVTQKPDDDLIEIMLSRFKMITFDRHFTSDRLNHYIFNLYY